MTAIAASAIATMTKRLRIVLLSRRVGGTVEAPGETAVRAKPPPLIFLSSGNGNMRIHARPDRRGQAQDDRPRPARARRGRPCGGCRRPRGGRRLDGGGASV